MEHEKIGSYINSYFNNANDNVDSLDLNDASTHMLLISKMFMEYVNLTNRSFTEGTEGHISQRNADKIHDFLQKMVVILSEQGITKNNAYLYQCGFFNKEKIRSVLLKHEELSMNISEKATRILAESRMINELISEELNPNNIIL